MKTKLNHEGASQRLASGTNQRIKSDAVINFKYNQTL